MHRERKQRPRCEDRWKSIEWQLRCWRASYKVTLVIGRSKWNRWRTWGWRRLCHIWIFPRIPALVAEIMVETYIAVFVKCLNLLMITTEFIMCVGNVSGLRDGQTYRNLCDRWRHTGEDAFRSPCKVAVWYQPFKDETYACYIRTQSVPRCKHSAFRL